MIKKMSKKEILQRLEKLDCKAPTNEPIAIFMKCLKDGTVEAVEHYGVGVSPMKDRLYNSIRQVKTVFDSEAAFDEHFSTTDLSKCPIFIDDLEE